MSIQEIITLIILGVVALAGIISIIIAIVRGEMKKFIEEKMAEAEKSGKTGAEKLAFVLNAVKDKYKILQVILNVKAFIEHIISISKQINGRK